MRKRDKSITWHDLVRKVFPGMSDEDAGSVLWEATAFPCCGIWHTFKQLREHKIAGRLTAGAMISFSHAEMDAAMAAYREENPTAASGDPA